MLFSELLELPQDPLLEAYRQFLADPRDDKANLSIGIYYDSSLEQVLFPSVAKAENLLAERKRTRGYLPQEGSKEFIEHFAKLVLGEELFSSAKERMLGMQTLGATGALHLGARIMKDALESEIYVSDPTWGNHKHIFSQEGMKILYYPYLNQETNDLHLEAMLERLSRLPKGSACLFHACCHNPTGIDPSPEEWKKILDLCEERELFPFFDMAYQGLGDGLEEDAFAVREFASRGMPGAIAVSASKNFGLYGERVGALLMFGNGCDAAVSRLKSYIRGVYSNPPTHGVAIVAEILSNADLKKEWESDLGHACQRLRKSRISLHAALHQYVPDRDFSFITRHKGMFSLLGLNVDEVRRLKEDFAIYVAPAGRINVAGFSEKSLQPFCEAFRKVVYRK